MTEHLVALTGASIPDAEFRALAEDLPTLCWLANGDGYIVWYNRRWHQYCGTTPADMEGWGWQSVHDPQLLPEVLERWTSAVAEGAPFEMTFPLRGADGVFRPFLTRIIPLRDGSGQVARWFGVNTEVSKVVAAEQAARDFASERDEAVNILQTFIESVPGVVYAKDREGRMLLGNKGTSAAFGVAPADYLGKTALETLTDRAQATAIMATDRRIMDSGRGEQVEEAVQRPDGSVGYYFSTKEPLRNEAGEVVGLVGSSIDVTAQKAAQQLLAESEARLRGVLNGMAEGYILLDRDFRILDINQAGRRIDGRPRAEIVGRTLLEVWPEAEHLPTWPAYQQAMRTGEPVAFEYRHMSDVHDVWLSVSAYRVDDKLAVFYADVSERKQIEDARRLASERFASLAAEREAILSQLAEGVIVTDQSGRIIFVNEAAERLHGVKLLDVPPDQYSEAYHLLTEAGAPYPPEELPLARAVLRGETVVDARWRIRRASGDDVLAIGSARPIKGADGNPSGAVLTVRDDTKRMRAELELREAEERYRLAARATNDAIWDWNLEMGDIVWNEAVAALFGHSEALSGTRATWWLAQIHPDDRERVHDSIYGVIGSGENRWEDEYRFRRADGSYAFVFDRGTVLRDEAGKPLRMIGAMLDLTERKRVEAELAELNATLERRVAQAIAEREQAEEALRQAQKMEAVGQLTGGIAHDFNNLLTVVTGNIDMARRALEAAGGGDARSKRALDSAMKGAERAASLTQRLLAFSRRQPLAPKPLDVDRLVLGMSDMLNRTLGETVAVEIVSTPGLWRVEADPNQLESAILNLAVNARDAMPQGGTLSIETANVRLDEEYSAAHAEVAPGQYVVVTVTDTGTGMDKDTLGRVFEPFFTTKDVGKGTGLGLSQVYGFTKQSGGHIKIYSERDKGTSVRLYLPRLLAEGEAELEKAAPPAVETSVQRETILAVEDDDDVRAYTVESLRELGYHVLEAHDGPAALKVAERHDGPIDLLFTDVVMPHMSGRELADALRERLPNLRVLYTSGYTRNAIVHGGRLDEGVAMLSKPFTFQALGEKVRDMLEAGRTRRVLVVEDEPTVRALTVEAATRAGFVAEEAATAAEALMKVRAARGGYDVVIMDNGLPDKAGSAVIAELRAMHAELPVVLASGEQADELRERFNGDSCVHVLPKPFTAARLIEAMAAVGLACQSEEGGN